MKKDEAFAIGCVVGLVVLGVIFLMSTSPEYVCIDKVLYKKEAHYLSRQLESCLPI